MPQLFFILSLVLFQACGKAGSKSPSYVIDQLPGTTEPEVQETYLKIFSSLSKMNGSLGKDLAQVDGLCQSDATALGLSGTYKAMVTTDKRRACQSADCLKGGLAENLDWVFSPETEYRLPDGRTIVGKTNESALLQFPLKYPLSSSSVLLWTGFSDYWTRPYYNFESCAGLTNVLETGFVGDASAVNADLLKKTSLSGCKKEFSVICVEQAIP